MERASGGQVRWPWVRRHPAFVRLDPRPVVRGGRAPYGRARAPRPTEQADDDDHGATARTRRAGRAGTGSRRRPCLADPPDRASPSVSARRRRGPARTRSESRRDAHETGSNSAQASAERSDRTMRSETVTTVVDAPYRRVFDYMSNISNL